MSEQRRSQASERGPDADGQRRRSLERMPRHADSPELPDPASAAGRTVGHPETLAGPLSDGPDPSVGTVGQALAGADSPARVQAVGWLQREVGNAATSRLIGDLGNSMADPRTSRASPRPVARNRPSDFPRVQRHPPGARPSIDVNAAVADLGGAAGPAAAPPAPGAAPAAAPAAAGPAPAVGPTTAPPTPGPAPAGGGAAPARPVGNVAMDLATAESALNASFGGVHRMVRAPIILLDKAALLAAYDNDAISRGVLFTDPATGTTRPWKKGDANPNIEGFALNDRSAIYVQKDTVLPTATAHELLHSNTATDFRGAVGEAINEGTTEYLAKKAVAAAGLPTVGPTGSLAYPTQVTAVEKLIKVVGEATLIQAYFGGAQVLVDAYEAIMPHTFAELKGAGTMSTAHMAALLVPQTVPQKVLRVLARLRDNSTAADFAGIRAICSSDPADLNAIRSAVAPRIQTLCEEHFAGWVSDADLDAIEALYHLPCAEGAPIRASLEPRAGDLIDIGQRTRFRVIFAG